VLRVVVLELVLKPCPKYAPLGQVIATRLDDP